MWITDDRTSIDTYFEFRWRFKQQREGRCALRMVADSALVRGSRKRFSNQKPAKSQENPRLENNL